MKNKIKSLLAAPFNWANRKFTLWRLRPARSVLLDEHGSGRLNSRQLHQFDARMLQRCGFSYLVAMICALAMLAISASAQVTSQNLTTLTNLPATLAGTSASTNAGTTLTLWQNSGIALGGQFNVATNGGGTGPAGFWVWPTLDGTNYPPAPITVMGTLSTSNIITIQTNWPASYLAGFVAIKVQLTNANTGTMTNYGVNVNKWRAPTPY